jgi:transposase
VAAGKKNAARLRAHLVFLDESGFMMAPLVRRSWAKRRCTPVLYQRGRSHEKVSAIAALCVAPCRSRLRLYFRLHRNENIRAPLVVEFLRALKRQLGTSIVIIWDRLAAHRSRAVKVFLKAHPRIRVEFLPPYAPELNPAEYVWSYLKHNPLANAPYYETISLAASARCHTRRLQHKEELLRSFLRHSPLSLRLK